MRGRDIRRIVLDQSRRAGVGHIGSALCVADILAVLYSGVLRMPSPEDPERDRFILSKGHAALALYAALHLRGWVSHRQLDTFCGEDTLLGAHPERGLCGVDFSTGSLGHGLSVGAGAALAARLDRSPRRTFVLVSDAECNEGSLWEAAMFAAHHRLASLVAVVDLNGQQALGPTAGILDTAPLAARWTAFGWDTHEVDGHDADALAVAATQLDTTAGAPHVLVARTVFGRGVSFMERQHRWHYLPMSEAEYARALAEVEAMP